MIYKINKDVLLEEATKFEKEIKKKSFSDQVDWRRKKALNQLNTFGKGVDNGAYMGISHISPLIGTLDNMSNTNSSAKSTLRNYDRSGEFKNLSAIEAQGQVSPNKEKEFLSDFKAADRAREQQLKNQANAFADISKDYKFRKEFRNNKAETDTGEMNLGASKRVGENHINVYSSGGYHNINNFVDKNKKSSKLLWVAPEGSKLLNDPGNKYFYARKSYDIGDVPASLSAQVKNSDLVNSRHVGGSTNKDEALLMKNTNLQNYSIERLKNNLDQTEIYKPRNSGIKSSIHFDNNVAKYI